jgi:hypothetical protein
MINKSISFFRYNSYLPPFYSPSDQEQIETLPGIISVEQFS